MGLLKRIRGYFDGLSRVRTEHRLLKSIDAAQHDPEWTDRFVRDAYAVSLQAEREAEAWAVRVEAMHRVGPRYSVTMQQYATIHELLPETRLYREDVELAMRFGQLDPSQARARIEAADASIAELERRKREIEGMEEFRGFYADFEAEYLRCGIPRDQPNPYWVDGGEGTASEKVSRALI